MNFHFVGQKLCESCILIKDNFLKHLENVKDSLQV